jgi:hypothetical protein
LDKDKPKFVDIVDWFNKLFRDALDVSKIDLILARIQPV